jgi:gamma-glutamyltranspeptidase
VTATQAYLFEILGAILRTTPEAEALFAPGGDLLAEGDRFRSEQLADAIALLGAEGAAPFYTGAVATEIAAWVGERGGVLTAADLAAYAPVAREPVRASYRGRDVLTNPPPNAGGVLLALALQRLDATAGRRRWPTSSPRCRPPRTSAPTSSPPASPIPPTSTGSSRRAWARRPTSRSWTPTGARRA